MELVLIEVGFLFSEQLLRKTMFERLHFHEVILVNKSHQPLVQESGIRFQTKKYFIINLFKVINE